MSTVLLKGLETTYRTLKCSCNIHTIQTNVKYIIRCCEHLPFAYRVQLVSREHQELWDQVGSG